MSSHYWGQKHTFTSKNTKSKPVINWTSWCGCLWLQEMNPIQLFPILHVCSQNSVPKNIQPCKKIEVRNNLRQTVRITKLRLYRKIKFLERKGQIVLELIQRVIHFPWLLKHFYLFLNFQSINYRVPEVSNLHRIRNVKVVIFLFWNHISKTKRWWQLLESLVTTTV